jgi:hypothetical protein
VEDYLGYSYAPQGIIQTPFSNQVRIDEAHAQGNNVELRNRLMDGIHFEKSFHFDWELFSWQTHNSDLRCHRSLVCLSVSNSNDPCGTSAWRGHTSFANSGRDQSKVINFYELPTFP